MEQIHPKALICFETRTTLCPITSNSNVPLNHRELSPKDSIQTSHKLALCLWVNGGKEEFGIISATNSASSYQSPSNLQRGNCKEVRQDPRSSFP